MPAGIWNLQWENHNSQRSYPLAAHGSCLDKTETIRIPDSFLTGLRFPIHAGLVVEPDKFFIHSLGIYPTGFSIVIGYDDGSSDPPVVATSHIASASHTEGRQYAIAGSGDFYDSVGVLTIGKLDDINALPPGVYYFTAAATPIEVHAIKPMIRGVSSITVVNGTDRSDPYVGDLEFVAGSNFRIIANEIEGQPTQLVFSAISGEGLNEECACEDADPGTCIRFINGIPPLPNGNFRVVGNDCIRIDPVDNGLELTDICSQPCCGCEELQSLITQLNRFADGVVTLQNFATTLGVQVTQMSQTVLGSRISDIGCEECG